MNARVRLRDILPRRADGLPPGQRAVRAFPRFSDKPQIPPPSTEINITIAIDGVPLATLHVDDLDLYEQVDQVSDFHCVTTWSYRDAHWRGVRLTDVVRAVVPGSLPMFAVAFAADGAQSIYVTEDLMHDDVLLATHLDGHPLDGRHGAPVRLVSPRQYGYKNLKHVTGIEFRADEPTSTFGAKEHLRGRVTLEERHASLPNWLVRVPYRLIVPPTVFVAERAARRPPSTPVTSAVP